MMARCSTRHSGPTRRDPAAGDCSLGGLRRALAVRAALFRRRRAGGHLGVPRHVRARVRARRPASPRLPLPLTGGHDMMVNLLVRGMLVGALAGLLVLLFAEIFGEPQVDLAIAFEEQSAAAEHEHAAAPSAAEPAAGHSHDAEEELVSRGVQSTVGLGTAVSCLWRRHRRPVRAGLRRGLRPDRHPKSAGHGRSSGALGFVAVYLVPALKYPANPPAVGNPDSSACAPASICSCWCARWSPSRSRRGCGGASFPARAHGTARCWRRASISCWCASPCSSCRASTRCRTTSRRCCCGTSASPRSACR